MTFTRAQTVAVGEVPTAAKYNSLARAFSDRLLSGVGDGAWRIIWLMLSLVRQPRNPQGVAGPVALWPPADEWFKVYGLINPENNPGLEWPGDGYPPGSEGGIALSWPMAAFVFGTHDAEDDNYDPDRNLLQEDLRFGGVPMTLPGGAYPVSLSDWWTLAKSQRGRVDLAAGVQAAPVIRAGQEHWKITYHPFSLQLKTYGGYFPTRLKVGDCGDGTADADPTPIRRVEFTNLHTGQKKFFYGICPEGSPGAALDDAIWGVAVGRAEYHVYRWDGNVEVLSQADWVEGPYRGGGQLQKDSAEMVDEVLHTFATSFRGSDTQREDSHFKVKPVAFDFERFLKRPFALAPARGTYAAGSISGAYPRWVLEANAVAGAAVPLVAPTAGDVYTIGEGYWLAGLYAQGVGLERAVTVEIQVRPAGAAADVGWTVTERCTLTPGDTPAGDPTAGEVLRYLDAPLLAQGVRPEVRVRLVGDLTLSPGGWVLVEVAELQAYRPQMQDAYTLLRLASTSGGDGNGQAAGLDNYGAFYDDAPRISGDYLERGAIGNPHASGLPDTGSGSIVENPVYEAARRLVIENTRLAHRDQLTGYEVVGGKSVLHFKRFALLQNVEGGTALDLWDGIGPSAYPVKHRRIRPGWKYRVSGGVEVRYNGAVVAAGAEFTGVAEVVDWENTDSSSGLESIVEVEGIYRTAAPMGETNRWCLFLNYHVARNDENSEWKPSNYGDVMAEMGNRCHLGSPGIARNPLLLQHFARGQKPVVLSETPSGYMYAEGTHHWDVGRYVAEDQVDAAKEQARRFYKSCQVYQAPYEIESVTAYTDGGGQQRVKVVLTERLRRCPSAPAAVALDVGTWSKPQLDAQEYRSDESGLMDYLWHQAHGTPCRKGVLGDLAPDSYWATASNDPDGACYPRAWMVRLPREVYEDSPANSTVERNKDSRMIAREFAVMELYLRAMCEGYIDEAATVGLQDCRAGTSHLFDYTFQNLMLEANGSKWMRFLPSELRPDNPRGYGPVPNTGLYAEVFNQFARAVNLLTKARLDLPLVVEYRVRTSIVTRGVTPPKSSGLTPSACGGDVEFGSGTYFKLSEIPAQGTDYDDPPWETGSSFGATSSATAYRNFENVLAFACVGGQLTWGVRMQQQKVEYRLQDTALAYSAVPDLLKPLITGGHFGLLGRVQHTTHHLEQGTPDAEYARCCLSANCESYQTGNGAGTPNIQYAVRDATRTECLLLPPSGTLTPDELPDDTLLFGWRCGPSEVVRQEVADGPVNGISFDFPASEFGGNLFLRVPVV